MRFAIWIVFVVIALGWAGLATLSAFIGESLLGAVAAGSAASAGAAWTLPPWVGLLALAGLGHWLVGRLAPPASGWPA